MTLQELANKEDQLYHATLDLYRQPQSGQTDLMLQKIFIEYQKVHQVYANLSVSNIEALKRGLFIQWYAWSEPNYLTGIADLDENAENKIIEGVNELIDAGNADDEFIWMLNYYYNWDGFLKECIHLKVSQTK